MKITIKTEDVRQPDPMKAAVRQPLYRPRVVTSKKAYNRKKVKLDV